MTRKNSNNNDEVIELLNSNHISGIDESIFAYKSIENIELHKHVNIIGESAHRQINSVVWENTTFKNVYFHNFRFESNFFWDCNFIDCEFDECIIEAAYVLSTNFSKCIFRNSLIDASSTYLTSFTDVTIKSDFWPCLSRTTFRESDFYNMKFDCRIDSVEFIGQRTISYITELHFLKGVVDMCIFNGIDLTQSTFTDNEINQVSFNNCVLSEHTFNNVRLSHDGGVSHIDLQTILKSNLDKENMKLFGIYNDEAKDYIMGLVTELKFQSVFISYSFEDAIFARKINDLLRKNGVNTFLWERDARGGRRLKHIMSENIQKHDRLLFIASRHSLKSDACHYELSEAREKYKKDWNDIYFPIHIDNYLFEVDKERIPTEHQDEFWKNIIEIKKYNSIDFTMFKTEVDFKSLDFEDEVKKLIKDLKL